jgi:hypothetical protein
VALITRDSKKMKLTLNLTPLIVSVLLACHVPTYGIAAQVDAPSPAPCPTFTPLHGLFPVLIWLGIFPRPVMASTITASDTSTSVVIHPNPSDQITCGKAVIKTINDVVFTTRTLPSGKPIDLLMDIQRPEAPGRKPLVI